jgi:nitrate reductase cytochrome c-type subunit
MIGMEQAIAVSFVNARLSILKEIEQLKEQLNIARNLACTTWEYCKIHRSSIPTRTAPGSTDLLHENEGKLLEEIAVRRFYIICIHYPYIKDTNLLHRDDVDCFNYWRTKISLPESLGLVLPHRIEF